MPTRIRLTASTVSGRAMTRAITWRVVVSFMQKQCSRALLPFKALASHPQRSHVVEWQAGRTGRRRVPVGRIDAAQMLHEEVEALAFSVRAAGSMVGPGLNQQVERLVRS